MIVHDIVYRVFQSSYDPLTFIDILRITKWTLSTGFLQSPHTISIKVMLRATDCGDYLWYFLFHRENRILNS